MLKRLLMILTLFLMLPLLGCQSTVLDKKIPYEHIPMKAPTPNWESPEEIARVEKPLYVAITLPTDLTTHLDIKPKDPISNPWPPDELKQIDFDKEIGMFLTLGLKRTGGMSLQVETIKLKETSRS